MKQHRAWKAGLAAAAIVVGMPSLGVAQTADFSNERIEFIIPFGAGGSTDVWARFLAPYLEKYLPGNPTVLPVNQPGGGSIPAANQFQNAEPDGLTIFGSSGSTHLAFLLEDPRVQYDLTTWTPVLASPGGGVTTVSPDLGVDSIEEIQELTEERLVFASQGPATLDMVDKLSFELLDLDVQIVFGLQGRGEARLMFERGETNIDFQATSAYLQNTLPLVEQGKAVPLFSKGVIDAEGNMQRDPTFPDVPSFKEAYEAMHGEEPSGIEWEAYKAVSAAGFSIQKMLMLPPSTPEHIVEAYTEALEKTLADPDFQERAAEELGAYQQFVGDEVAAVSRVALGVDPETREWIRNWLVERFNYQP